MSSLPIEMSYIWAMTLFKKKTVWTRLVGMRVCMFVCVWPRLSSCLQDGGHGEAGTPKTMVLNDARLLLLVYIGASCDWRRTGKGTQRWRSVGGWKACL